MKEKTSNDELQKSIQLATNVLDLSEDDRCSGCCNYPKQDYGHPRIVLVNGTSKVMRLQGSNVMNITGKWYYMSKNRPLSQRKRTLKHCTPGIYNLDQKFHGLFCFCGLYIHEKAQNQSKKISVIRLPKFTTVNMARKCP